MINETLKKLEELETMYKKINLLERKQDRMGLDELEMKNLKKMKTIYYSDVDVVVGTTMGELMDMLLSVDGKKYLKNIQKKVPWDGKKIYDFDSFENILSHGDKLSKKDIDYLEDNLIKLHADTFKGFETICSDKAIHDSLVVIGTYLPEKEKDGILSVIKYIDNTYKDFAEIFGINLPEVKMYYY